MNVRSLLNQDLGLTWRCFEQDDELVVVGVSPDRVRGRLLIEGWRQAESSLVKDVGGQRATVFLRDVHDKWTQRTSISSRQS